MRLLHDSALLSATIGTVYDCVLRPEGWEPLMAELAAMVGGRRAHLGVATAHGQVVTLAVNHGIAVDESLYRYGPLNPMLPLGLTWPQDKALVASRDYGLEALHATRYYREYLAPRGDRDALAFVAVREGAAIGHWLLVTQEDRPPLTEAEAAGFELLAPHVRRAIEISNVLGMQRFSAETYRAALDELDAAVLIVDADGRPSFANPAATQRARVERATGRDLFQQAAHNSLSSENARSRACRPLGVTNTTREPSKRRTQPFAR